MFSTFYRTLPVWSAAFIAINAMMPPAYAQSSSQTFKLNIPQQALRKSIVYFGKETGFDVIADGAVTERVTAHPVSGTMTAQQALATMLKGSGVQYRFTDEHTVILETSEAWNARAQALTLDTVEVNSNQRQENGYVATRGMTATKTSTPLIETPQSVSVVTQEQIRDTGARTVGEALSYTAGVQTQPFGFDARYDQFLIRGFAANQFGNYRDGLRQGNGTFAYFRNEPYGLERLEVLRGPTSVLYGANDVSGLVNMVSKMPQAYRFNEFGVDFGNFQRYQGRFDLNGPAVGNENVLYRFTGLFRDSGTQVPDTWDDRLYFAPAFTFKLAPETTLTLLASIEKNKNSMWPYYLRLPGVGVTDVRVGDKAFDDLNQSEESIGYRLEHRASDNVTLRQNMRYGHVDWRGNFVDAAGAPVGGILPRYAGAFSERLNVFSVDNNVEWKVATGPLKHTVLAGVDYFWQSADLVQAFNFTGNVPSININNPVYGNPVPGPFTIGNASFQTVNQIGAYVQDQIAFDRWRLTLGGREDFAYLDNTVRTPGATFGQTTENNDKSFTYRAGLLYLFDVGLAPYVNYATSFLPQTGTTAVARGATPFVPTTGKSFEAGIKYQAPGSSSYITAAYYNLIKNNVLTTDPIYGGANRVQTGQIRSRGVEIEAVATLAAGLKAIASYAYTDARVTESNSTDLDKVPVAVPRNQAALFVDYTFQNGALAGFGMGAGVRYIGENWADPINTFQNPAVTVVDAALHYDYQNFRFAVNARNLFDKREGLCNTGNCTISVGRTVLVSATARW